MIPFSPRAEESIDGDKVHHQNNTCEAWGIPKGANTAYQRKGTGTGISLMFFLKMLYQNTLAAKQL